MYLLTITWGSDFFMNAINSVNYSILTITQSRKGCSIRIESIIDNLERKNNFLFRKGKSKVQRYLEIARQVFYRQ